MLHKRTQWGIAVVTSLFIYFIYRQYLYFKNNQNNQNNKNNYNNYNIIHENFMGTPTGITTGDNGDFGISLSNGSDLVNGSYENIPNSKKTQDKNKLEDLKKKKQIADDMCHESKKINEQIDNIQGTHEYSYGICVVPNSDEWGVILPKYGKNKCIPMSKIKKTEEKSKKKKKSKKKQPIIMPHPTNATDCVKSSGLDELDTMCHKIFDSTYGTKETIKSDCPDGYRRAICEKGYKKGHKVPGNHSQCYPSETDFNVHCSNEYGYGYGWKSHARYDCNKGYERAVCSDNYWSGIPKYGYATDCMLYNSKDTLFNNACKNLYGKGWMMKTKIGGDCKPGFGRAQCYNPKIHQ